MDPPPCGSSVGTSVVRMAGQGRMVDPFHLGMSVKKGCNAQGIGYMALYPKRKCFQSLKQQESIERADGGAVSRSRTERMRVT